MGRQHSDPPKDYGTHFKGVSVAIYEAIGKSVSGDAHNHSVTGACLGPPTGRRVNADSHKKKKKKNNSIQREALPVRYAAR